MTVRKQSELALALCEVWAKVACRTPLRPLTFGASIMNPIEAIEYTRKLHMKISATLSTEDLRKVATFLEELWQEAYVAGMERRWDGRVVEVKEEGKPTVWIA